MTEFWENIRNLLRLRKYILHNFPLLKDIHWFQHMELL